MEKINTENLRENVRNLLIKLHLMKLYVFVITCISVILYKMTRRKLFEVDVKSYWSDRSRTTDIYSESIDYDPYYAKFNSCIINEIRELPDVKTIIEVGCFVGNRLSLIHKAMPEKKITGCDLGSDQLHICKFSMPHLDSVDLIQCDAAYLPFKNNTFDLVFTSGCLEHIPDSSIEKTIDELNRIGKKHLLLVEAYIRHMSFRRKFQMLSISYFYMHNYEKLLQKAGFKKVKLYGIPDENQINRYSVFVYQKM